MPPTITVKDSMDINISGVRLNLFTVPGETGDVLVVWLPEKKLMVQIANFYEAFPAITTLRGAYPRDPLFYIDSIDFYRSLNAEYLVLCHGPHPILKGAENISREITNYRDAIQFIHDQTGSVHEWRSHPGRDQRSDEAARPSGRRSLSVADLRPG